MTVAQRQDAPASQGSGSWAWAVGTFLVVALVMAGAYAGHRYVAAARLAAAHVAAPATPPPGVVDALRPGAGAAFAAQVGVGGRLVLLSGAQERPCPLTGPCGSAPALDTLSVVDEATHATVIQAPLASADQHPVALAVDPRAGVADVVSASTVGTYASATGARSGGFALPASVSGGPYSGATTSDGGLLLLTARQSDQPVLLGLDERSGAPHFSVVLPSATRLDGPIVDAAGSRVLILAQRGDTAELVAYSAKDGSQSGTWTVPTGTRLGPLSESDAALYLFGPDGTTSTVSLAALTPAPSATPAPLVPVPALRGAQALGWNETLHHVYVADTHALRILDAATGRTLAALPVAVAWAPDTALPVDETAGLLYLPADHGTLVVVHDASGPASGALTADTALILARAAVVRLVPQGQQDPLFVTDDTFAPGPGTRAASFWAYDPTLGWQNASPGTADVRVASARAPGGAYDVTFSIRWTLHGFVHTHTTVCQVAPTGATQLVSDQGDGLP